MEPGNIFRYFLLALLFLFNAPSIAQQTPKPLINKTYENTPLLEVFEGLNRENASTIYFKEAWLKGKSYTGTITNKTLMQTINSVIANTELMAITIDNNFYLLPKEEIALILKHMANLNTSLNHKQSSYTIIGDIRKSGEFDKVRIEGQVTDGATNEPLVGSKLFIENTNYYSVTGYTGHYVLEVPAGNYKLKVTSMGFEDKNINIKAISPGTLNVDMFEESHAINEVLITGEKQNSNITRQQMSIIEINAKTIKQLPSLIGERDIIKSFSTMPGVKTASEFGSGINVRGGGEDQNLYLLENSPIYNTSHVMGLLSVINPDAVHGVSLYKGHIPIEYGERVSSVMDIKIQDHTIDEFKLKGGIGIYSSRLLFETPLWNKRMKLKIGARTSYSDYLLKQMPDYNLQHSSASFYDITGSLAINLKNNPITVFGYLSHDNFKYINDFSYNYGNKLGSLSWVHIFNPALSSELNASYSNYHINHENTEASLFSYLMESEIESVSGKASLKYLGIHAQEVNFGVQGIKYNVNPGNRRPVEQSQIEPFNAEQEQGFEASVFIGDEVTLTPKLSFQAGLRYTVYQLTGPKTTYQYKEHVPVLPENIIDTTKHGNTTIANYNGLEPRVSLKYVLSDNESIKLSYNKNKQYLSLLSYTSISTPEDTWKLADKNLKPIIANQVALGYYRNFLDNSIETSVELYAKHLQNLTEYRNGAELKFNSHIETELLNATGKNYGIELLVKKKEGKLKGALSYTYSRAWKQTNGKWLTDMINGNNRYPSQYDIPHALNVSMNYHVNRRIRLGATFAYSSGRPVTLPEYTYFLGRNELVFFSPRNKYRLPDYHRLDLSLSIDESLKKSKSWKGSWTFALLNVYGRKNAYSIFYKKDTPTKENNYQVFSLYKLYLIGIPMPTITYNFIF